MNRAASDRDLLITPDLGRGGLTHLSLETAVMASLSLTQKRSRCREPEMKTFGKQAYRLLDLFKPYQRN